MSTVCRAPVAVGDVVGAEGQQEEVPRPLWVLGGAGGKTIIELVLLNLVRFVCMLDLCFVLVSMISTV